MEKYVEIAKHHDEKYAYDRVIWKTKLVSEVDGESDDKYRVLQSMKRLTSSRLDLSTPENEIWLTTREIANEMDISIYSMRYLLCQMESTGAVICIKTGSGRGNTLRWKLASLL